MSSNAISPAQSPTLPRITIQFCTQCRWMLRAAYFAQELLSTFGTAIGEIALQPTTGGVFRVELTYTPIPSSSSSTAAQSSSAGNTNSHTLSGGKAVGGEEEEGVVAQRVLLWDRKAEGGFPETKVLKQRVRDRLEPKRDLGHSDVNGKAGMKKAVPAEGNLTGEKEEVEGKKEVEKEVVEGEKVDGKKEAQECEDCK